MSSRRRRGARHPAASSTPTSGPVSRFARAGAVLLVVATLVFVAVVRLRVADTPLERDEGEYAYAGQLILQGIPPYELAYNMKYPGTYYAYGLIMAVFGETSWGIRVGLLFVHASTVVLLWVFARRLIGEWPAGIAASAFAILALDRWTMGVFAHATHFVLLPAVGGLVLLRWAMRSGRAHLFVAAGALTGLAVIMKQQAVVFPVLAVGLATWSEWASGSRRFSTLARRGVLVAAGALLPFAILCAVLAAQGVLGRFWFWTFQYAAAYVSQTPLSDAPAMFGIAWRYITQDTWVMWYAAAAGLVLLVVARWTAEVRVTLLAWLAAAVLSICPGFFFRPHYFIVLLPVAGILIGVVAASLERWFSRRLGPVAARAGVLLLFLGAAGTYVVREADYLFRMSTAEVSRSVYGGNPFIEAVEIARYIQAHSAPDDRIAVLGSEPEIYFYANRKSATGYVYTYALMESQPYASRMQDEMIREIEAARPPYLVFVGVAMSWAGQPGSDTRILTWANQYTAACYERVGIADIDPARGTTIRWDVDSRDYQPQSSFVVLTFRRRSGPACG